MSKYVRVNDSVYKLTVKTNLDNGTIVLDSGNNPATTPGDWQGGVIVTGDLLVLGNSTTVSTVNMSIEDNIITLNKGETGAGVTEGTAGIEIDRGSQITIRLLFDESIVYTSPSEPFPQFGAFVLKRADDRLVALRTNVIDTDGGNLLLIGSKAGATGVISVAGTNNYEDQITDDDHIPNRKWITDFALDYFENNPPKFIQEADSILEINDQSDTGTTQLTLALDGTSAAIWRTDYHEVQKIGVADNRIYSTVENADLVLAGDGTGAVTVDSVLKVLLSTSDPSQQSTGTKIYVKEETFDYSTNVGVKHCGGSGVFFVNKEEVRDELVSRRKALAFSMIF